MQRILTMRSKKEMEVVAKKHKDFGMGFNSWEYHYICGQSQLVRCQAMACMQTSKICRRTKGDDIYTYCEIARISQGLTIVTIDLHSACQSHFLAGCSTTRFLEEQHATSSRVIY
jgi:hypothetical protein